MKKIKQLLLLVSTIFFIGCIEDIPVDPTCEELGNCPEPKPKDGVRYAGIRSSYYGFGDGSGEWERNKFPTPTEAATVIKNIAAKFEGATPSAVWIIGGIMSPWGDRELAACRLEFPEPEGGTPDTNIWFSEEDKHTPYLEEFDKIGAKVFLQVEPGAATMEELIRLCLNKYGHHESVIGFGFDVEWYPSSLAQTNGTNLGDNTPLSPQRLQKLTDLVKKHGKELKVMSKHWEKGFVGGTTNKVEDVMYFSSSQGVGSALEAQFADWADSFYPNEVGFQIGYNNDTDVAWWSSYEDPIREITDVILGRMRTGNVINIYWTDFTIRWNKFDYLWK